MTAVVEIAKECRERLAAELAMVEDFIRMAGALAQGSPGFDCDPVLDAGIDADGAAPRVPPTDRGDDADRTSADAPAVDTVLMDSDESALNDKASVSEDELVLLDPLSNDAAPVSDDELVLISPLSKDATLADVHVGRRMYQRRRMMGMTQQKLADLVGVEIERIQKYETGAIHISAERMWDVAASMDVPMSYFFDGMVGQAPNTGEASGDVLTDSQAPAPVRSAPRARIARAS